MNKLHHLLAAGLLAGIGLAAQAQPAPAPGYGPAPRMMAPGEHAGEGHFQQFREQRRAQKLDELKRILQIAPQQEGAWNAWTGAMRPAQLQRFDRVEFARMRTPERIDRIRSLRTQRNAEMDRKLEATKVFYASLSPEQQRLFDAQGMRLLGGEGRGHRGGQWGHHRG